MPSKRTGRRTLPLLALALGLLLASAPAGHAGPISDMLARHRANRQVKLGPVEKPFQATAPRAMSQTPGITGNLKKRFVLPSRSSSSPVASIFNRGKDRDPGVVKTSR